MDKTNFDQTLMFVENIKKYSIQKEILEFNVVDTLSKNIKSIVNDHKAKHPYHINIIDLLWANENAHSRIFCELMKQNNNGSYEILESFIKRFFPNATNIDIRKPQISSEKYRIDILVQEQGKYAIIFENKIHNATLQKNQLARYIEKVKHLRFSENQIYVVYLPPNDYNQPNVCCWNIPAEWCVDCNSNDPSAKCRECLSYETSFVERFVSISFREDILPWLKDEVLHNCRMRETFLYTSIFQYIDHLEGMFDLRTTNHKLNMEIKEHIKKTLELTDNPEMDFAKVKQKIQDASMVLNHLNSLKDDIESECWNIWLNRLKQEHPGYQFIDYSADKRWAKVGIIMKYKDIEFAILIERESNIYYGIGRHDSSEALSEEIKSLVAPVLSDIGGFKQSDWWYGWKYTSFQNGYERLVTLINLVEKVINK